MPDEWQMPDYERSAEFAQTVIARLRIIAAEHGARSAKALLVLAAEDSQLRRLVWRGFAELAPELENEGVNVAEVTPADVFATIVGTLVELAMRDCRVGEEGRTVARARRRGTR